jgi:hypothetical protein
MSEFEQVQNNGSQQTTNYDISKIFIWDNRYADEIYYNAEADTVQLVPGTVLGRITASNKVVPLDAGASDGSQFPCGVLKSDYEVETLEDQEISMCISGDIAENKLVFNAYDDLDTVVDGRTIKDHLRLMGIRPIPSDEQTDYDNQP